MKKYFIPITIAFLMSCGTFNKQVDKLKGEEELCKASGGAFVFDHTTLSARCVPPHPDAPPEPVPAPTPPEPPEPVPGDWVDYAPGDSITIPYSEMIEFEVKGIDTRKLVEWHILDIAHGRGKVNEVSNAHVTIYSDTQLYLTQQVYKPLRERRHEDNWAFRPENVYRWVLYADLTGYRLVIYENEKLVVDMPRAQFGPWPVQSFQRIDNIRIGCGTFPGYVCPNPVKIKIRKNEQ